MATSCEELTHWKRLWCWAGLGAGGKGEDRGWGGWMAWPTRWTWVWVNSGRWLWTGKPGVLGSQRVRHYWATELNWTDPLYYVLFLQYNFYSFSLNIVNILKTCSHFSIICISFNGISLVRYSLSLSFSLYLALFLSPTTFMPSS